MANENQGQEAQINNSATVKYGVYNQPGPLVGKTVDQVRQAFAGQWNIPTDASAFKGKEQMAGDYVIQPGDVIEFHRRMGEKG